MNKDMRINNVVLKVNYSKVFDARPTLVFLHDSLGCIELWRDFPQKLALAANCNCLIYDRQGYGKSSPFNENNRKNDYLEKEADVLQLLIEEYGIKGAILFGHSDGGSIALIAAAKYPENIGAVITEGAHIFVEDITLQGIREVVEAYQTTNLKEKLQKYHGDKTGEVFWAWANTWLSNEFRDWNIEHFLHQIKCPVLVMQGENDEFGSLKQVYGIIQQIIGKAESLIIPSVGHTPHKDAKEIVLEKTTQFIQTSKVLYLNE